MNLLVGPGEGPVELLDIDGKKSQTLAYVIVELPGNPGALLFVRGDELAADAGKSFFRHLAFRNINT